MLCYTQIDTYTDGYWGRGWWAYTPPFSGQNKIIICDYIYKDYIGNIVQNQKYIGTYSPDTKMIDIVK